MITNWACPAEAHWTSRAVIQGSSGTGGNNLKTAYLSDTTARTRIHEQPVAANGRSSYSPETPLLRRQTDGDMTKLSKLFVNGQEPW
jgi:hypothetical protein